MRLAAVAIAAAMALGSGAAIADAPSPATAPAPTLAITKQGDSLRAIARWAQPCDARGCADTYRVTWLVGNAARSVRTLTRRVDTLWTAAPPWGDSVRITVNITAERRTLASPVRSASRVFRRPDSAPPAVDSLVIDSLRTALADSISQIMVRTPSGERTVALTFGQPIQWCTLGRNRYTNAVQVVTDPAWDHALRMRLERECEPARSRVATGAP